jgi:hypothetical protein
MYVLPTGIQKKRKPLIWSHFSAQNQSVGYHIYSLLFCILGLFRLGLKRGEVQEVMYLGLDALEYSTS